MNEQAPPAGQTWNVPDHLLNACLALAPHFSVHHYAGNKILLLSEDRSVRLSDPYYQQILPLLDGWMTGRQIISRLAKDETEEVPVAGFLSSMVDKGYVVPVEPWTDTARTALRSAAGLYPAGTEKALARFRVAVLAMGRESAAGSTSSAELAAMLAGEGLGITSDQTAADLALVVVDDYLQPSLQRLARDFADRQQAWLPFKPGGSRTLLGPMIAPHKVEGACYLCLARRMQEHRPGDRAIAAPPQGPRPARGWTKASLAQAQARASLVLVDLALGRESDIGTHLLAWPSHKDASELHKAPRFLDCPLCGQGTPKAIPQPLRLEARSGKVGSGEAWRGLSPAEALQRLEPTVSPLTGIVSSITALKPAEGLHVYTCSQGTRAPLDPRLNRTLGRPGAASGKGTTDEQARISCLAEAVERHSAQWSGSEPRRLARWRELAPEAPHPQALLGFSERQYAQREEINQNASAMNSVPKPFVEDAQIEWSPAWSLRDEEPRWLPARYCFYDYRNADVPEDHDFCYADSNGCASGGCLEEAILQGFLELVERDAVALWWYNRLRRPGIHLESLNGPFPERVLNYCRERGEQLHLLDLTSDLGIPVVAAVSARADGTRPMIGLGSHFDRESAALRALTELVQCAPFADSKGGSDEGDDKELKAWLQTASFETHSYLLPTAQTEEPKPPVQRFEGTMAEAVRRCVEITAEAGHDFIVQDLSRPDLPLNCVRVVAPGLRHFWNRRGPGRLYDAPVRMGWVATATPEEELNPVSFFL